MCAAFRGGSPLAPSSPRLVHLFHLVREPLNSIRRPANGLASISYNFYNSF